MNNMDDVIVLSNEKSNYLWHIFVILFSLYSVYQLIQIYLNVRHEEGFNILGISSIITLLWLSVLIFGLYRTFSAKDIYLYKDSLYIFGWFKHAVVPRSAVIEVKHVFYENETMNYKRNLSNHVIVRFKSSTPFGKKIKFHGVNGNGERAAALIRGWR